MPEPGLHGPCRWSSVAGFPGPGRSWKLSRRCQKTRGHLAVWPLMRRAFLTQSLLCRRGRRSFLRTKWTPTPTEPSKVRKAEGAQPGPGLLSSSSSESFTPPQRGAMQCKDTSARAKGSSQSQVHCTCYADEDFKMPEMPTMRRFPIAVGAARTEAGMARTVAAAVAVALLRRDRCGALHVWATPCCQGRCSDQSYYDGRVL